MDKRETDFSVWICDKTKTWSKIRDPAGSRTRSGQRTRKAEMLFGRNPMGNQGAAEANPPEFGRPALAVGDSLFETNRATGRLTFGQNDGIRTIRKLLEHEDRPRKASASAWTEKNIALKQG